MFVRHVHVLIFRMKQEVKMVSATEAGIPAALACLLSIHQVITRVRFRARGGDKGSCISFHICPNVTDHWDVLVVADVQAAARLI